jgi:hypothetical protein
MHQTGGTVCVRTVYDVTVPCRRMYIHGTYVRVPERWGVPSWIPAKDPISIWVYIEYIPPWTRTPACSAGSLQLVVVIEPHSVRPSFRRRVDDGRRENRAGCLYVTSAGQTALFEAKRRILGSRSFLTTSQVHRNE